MSAGRCQGLYQRCHITQRDPTGELPLKKFKIRRFGSDINHLLQGYIYRAGRRLYQEECTNYMSQSSSALLLSTVRVERSTGPTHVMTGVEHGLWNLGKRVFHFNPRVGTFHTSSLSCGGGRRVVRIAAVPYACTPAANLSKASSLFA